MADPDYEALEVVVCNAKKSTEYCNEIVHSFALRISGVTTD